MADPPPARLVRSTLDRGVATITLDSQHNRNALSRQLVSELHEELDAAESAEARAVVLRHEGPAFCAGADLKERAAAVEGDTSDSRGMVEILERLMDTPRPITFALTEVRIGVAAAIISVPILRRVAPGRIASAMLTGETFDAEEARDIGLVTHVSDDVPDTVAALCDGVRAGAPRAVAETKRILGFVPALDRRHAFEEMGRLSAELFTGADAREGMAAFREKRLPSWNPDA